MIKGGIHFFKILSDLPFIKWQILLKGIWYSFFYEINFYLGKKPAIGKTKQGRELSKEKILVSKKYINDSIKIIGRRMPWNPKCHNLGLVARKLLNDIGVESQLHIGFKPSQLNNKIKGHAWVTIDDQVFTGDLPDLNRYKKIFTVG